MYKSQKGFTLVELIVVIVLLGILGVTALGKFQDISGDAENAAVEGIAAEISAAASINYAKSLVSPTPLLEIGAGATDIDTDTENCPIAQLQTLLTGNSIPAVNGKAVTFTTGSSGGCATAGDVYSCDYELAGAAFLPTVQSTIICTQ